ncbi:MAG: SDR family NAD(P)-dependent oxidoreductase [Thermoleophilia bacterium]|nr:SDR family NAD(P)-dependent oxidoreductase [Gaiellaceae bacterium]MDW8338551.1 SDR family NAD(P)-dependent oxidoreductase [Thermoleophilia bacterium]
MTVALVTGASGFIGGRLCERLLANGLEVHGIARSPRGDAGVRWWLLDLADSEAVETALRRIRPEVVYHLAGHVSGSRDLDAVVPSLRDNLVASVNVFVAAARAECPVVFAGSMEEPVAGATAVSPYAAAKHGAAVFARMLHALHGLRIAHLRVFMVFGPGQRDRTKLIPYVTTSLLRGVTPKLSSGTRLVDWIYVDDAVDALLAASTKVDDLAGTAVDVGSGTLVTVREVVERIRQLIRTEVTPEFGVLPERPNEVVRCADVRRAREVLGWSSRTDLTEGLERTVEWFRGELGVGGTA